MSQPFSYPSLQSQTWMEEEMEVERIIEGSQLVRLATARFLWKPCFPNSASSKVPATRFKHTTVFYRRHIYLLGGRGKQNTFKDLWRYCIDDNDWEKVQTEGCGPPALQEHTAVVHGTYMYVFGGAVSFDNTTPIWCLNLETLKWVALRQVKGGPCNRRGHSSVVYYDSMYVFGGFIDLKGSTNEFWKYDLETYVWTTVKPQHSRSEVVPPRYSHSSVVYNNSMWIYGGFETLDRKSDFWRWDFELLFWSKIRYRQGPPPLSGHSMAKVGSNIIIFGGENNMDLSNQMWRYSFETYKWNKVSPYGGISPPVRNFQTLIVLSPLTSELISGIDSQGKTRGETYCSRKDSFSKRGIGSKSNSADHILCSDKDTSYDSSQDLTTKASKFVLSRPRSVNEHMICDSDDLDDFTPVEVVNSHNEQYSYTNTTLPREQKSNLGRTPVFHIEEGNERTPEYCQFARRKGWALIVIGGKGKQSVEMHKTSLDVWQCDIGNATDIPPVSQPQPNLCSKQNTIERNQDELIEQFQPTYTFTKTSKRKFQSYDKLELTDISDSVSLESSPEQRPKLQETRRLLSK